MHVSEFLKNYTNLVQLTQQGMGKLNDQTTIDYIHCTNHDYRSLEALQQLIEKKHRIEFLEDHHCQKEHELFVALFATKLVTIDCCVNKAGTKIYINW